MHLFGPFTGIALAGSAGALLGSVTALAQNELGSSTLQPTAGMRTNAVSLTATNFVAGTATVQNGVYISGGTNNVPPTSILGTNVTVRSITLADAISMALQNNYDVQIVK